MFRIILFALMIPLSAFAAQFRATARHIERGGIGYEDGYTTLETFLACDGDVATFLDARGHVFDNGKWGANAGAGLRVLSGDRIYGINTYYDYRNTGHLISNQIGVGFETMRALFDIRINAYLPFGIKSSKAFDAAFDGFCGHYVLVTQKVQSAMKGANAEFGFHLAKSESFDLSAAVGPYFFIGEETPPTWGGKASLSCAFKNILAVEISNSYDTTFHNKFQGQLSLNYFFGSKPKTKCFIPLFKMVNPLKERLLQPVVRQEIIVINTLTKQTIATDPISGLPLYFVFVDNTSHSNGTFESPYPTLLEAEGNSFPNNFIYVFPGDGTTKGMDSGIALQASQRFWGSSISHVINTSQGTFSIPALSDASPTITNTNFDTDGNAITLATNNVVSGFTIDSPLNDAIYGTDPQNLEVSSCIFRNTNTFPIEASFPADASIVLTNNEFLNNVNGVFLTLNGTTTLQCSDNIFSLQTSVSSVPLEITANNNVLAAQIENNIFNDNTTGSVRMNFNNVLETNISFLGNTITNNGTGSQSSLGSSFVILTNGTVSHCTLAVQDNTFSNNTLNAIYLHTSGAFANLNITASANAMTNNVGSALVLATPVDTLTLLATDNTITGCNDNGIAVIASSLSTNGNISINNNSISNIGNGSNAIAINQDFSTLNLTILNNVIDQCEGTGILSYAPTGIQSLALNISGNTISNCQNLSSNAASGLDIEQYTNLLGSVMHNTLSGNTGLAVNIGSTLPAPYACLTLSDNDSSTDYLLSNPLDGQFNLSPLDANAVNTGIINTSGVITPAESCSP